MINKIWNAFMLKRKKVNTNKNLRISGRIYIHSRKGGIFIGENVTIHSSENVNPTSGMNHSHLRTDGNWENCNWKPCGNQPRQYYRI